MNYYEFLRNDASYIDDVSRVCALHLPWWSLDKKRVLLTGASGMIGTFLVDVLHYITMIYFLKIEVVAVGRDTQKLVERFSAYMNQPWFCLITHDVNMLIPELGRFDYIIHAASNTHPLVYAHDAIGTILTNILGTRNLLDYGICHDVERFVFLSSVEIYGENRGDVDKFDEQYCGYIDCNTLRAGYPESKRVGESLCQAYRHQHNLDFSVLRLCRVFGPTVQHSDSKAIAQFIFDAVANRDILLKSEGFQYYSYLYVADAVSALLAVVLKGEAGHAYNASSDDSNITLRELASVVAEAVGTNVTYDFSEHPEAAGYSKATNAILDSSKICTLGWEANTNIRDGIRRTVEMLRRYMQYPFTSCSSRE